LYAVGLLLIEMLNGPFPYGEYGVEEMQKRLSKGLPAPRREHLVPGPQVPFRLRTVIRKAISRKPDDRYPSARAMSEALSRVQLIDWEPVESREGSLVWEGECAQRRDRRFQVEARPRRNGKWTMLARQRVTRWQKFLPDQVVAEPTGPDATAFFDHVTKAAFSP
jgi:serine/threonine-protein kinase